MNRVQTQGGRSDSADSRSRRSRRARGERGVALVEFAIISPLIFALLIGMFTGGISMSRKNSMTNAVREGARLGATLNEDVTSPNWAEQVQQRVLDLAPNDLQLSQICVRLIQDGAVRAGTGRSALPAGCSARPAPPTTGIPAGQCAVQVWAYRTSELQVVFFSRILNLDAGSLSRYERAGSPATCGS